MITIKYDKQSKDILVYKDGVVIGVVYYHPIKGGAVFQPEEYYAFTAHDLALVLDAMRDDRLLPTGEEEQYEDYDMGYRDDGF